MSTMPRSPRASAFAFEGDRMLARMDSATTNAFHRRVTFLSGMGVFLEGYDFTNIASALIFIVPYFALSPAQTSLLAISTYLGTIVGAASIGYLADRLGRKKMYLFDISIYAGFALISALAFNYWMLVGARAGLGFAIGADQALSFTIIAEFAPSATRGRLNASTWVMWTIASLSTYAISLALNPVLHGNTWRFLFGLALIPSVLVIIGRSRLPESPRWLIQKGRFEEASAAIAQATAEVPAALQPPIVVGAAKTTYPRLGELFNGRRQIFGTLYIVFMWFCITFNTYGIGYFTPFIFKTLGFTSTFSLVGGVIVACFAVIGSLIMYWLVDRVGRKALAVAGFALLAIVDLGISLVSGKMVFGVLVALFSLFQLFAWIGPAGLVGVVAPEVFPTRVRSLGTGFAAAIGRLGSILGIVLFPILLSHVKLPRTMLVFCLDAVIATIAMMVFGRETKGKSLEELVPDLATS